MPENTIVWSCALGVVQHLVLAVIAMQDLRRQITMMSNMWSSAINDHNQ